MPVTGLTPHLLILTCDFSSVTSPELSFMYFMYGEYMGELYFNVYADGVWSNLYMIIGEQQTSRSEPWEKGIANLSYCGGKSEVILRFEYDGAISYKNDFCSLDLISIYDNTLRIELDTPTQLLYADFENPAVYEVSIQNLTGTNDNFSLEYISAGNVSATSTTGNLLADSTTNIAVTISLLPISEPGSTITSIVKAVSTDLSFTGSLQLITHCLSNVPLYGFQAFSTPKLMSYMNPERVKYPHWEASLESKFESYGNYIYAADFLTNDFSKVYAIITGTNWFVSFSTDTNATINYIGHCPSVPGRGIWTDMTISRDGTIYVVSDAGFLYTINPDTGAATFLTEIKNIGVTKAIAINRHNEMFAVEVATDRAQLYKINIETGDATVVGLLDWLWSGGISAAYEQGLEFDDMHDILYWAANSSNRRELLQVNPNTAELTLMGIPGTPPYASFDGITVALPTPGTVINGSFEYYNYTGWTVSGNGAFGNVPRKIPEFNMPKDGNQYANSGYNSAGVFDNSLTGVLQSEIFPLAADEQISMFIGGWSSEFGDSNEYNYVSLHRADDDVELDRVYAPNANNAMLKLLQHNTNISLNVYLKIVDDGNGITNAWISADDIESVEYSFVIGENCGFENGNFQDWIVSGTGWEITNLFPGFHGRFYASSFSDGTNSGTLRSTSFLLENYMIVNFLINGFAGSASGSNYVALKLESDGTELARIYPPNASNFIVASISLTNLFSGTNVYIEIVDNCIETNSGWISVDDFQIVKQVENIEKFEDVSDVVGLSALYQPLGNDHAIAWGDYNNDGWPDMYLGTYDATKGVYLFKNNDGINFENANIPNVAMWWPGIFIDYDNDGLQDLYSAMAGGHLARNLGNGTFLNQDSLLDAFPTQSECSVWADFNNDGRTEFYRTGWEVAPSGPYFPDARWLWNKTTSHFDLDWEQTSNTKAGRGVTCADFDEDGDQDIYVSNYRIADNYLWINDGNGNFTNLAAEYNVEHDDIPGSATYPGGHSIGSCFGDLDNDGHLDLVVGNFAHSSASQDRPMFYRNRGPSGNWYFEDKSSSVGLPYVESHASPALADFDNDGDLDFFITAVAGYYSGQRCTLIRNDGNWNFTDVSVEYGMNITTPNSNLQAAWADYDNDGDLDIMTGRKLYRNNLDNNNHWLKIKMVGDGTNINRDAIGAIVRIPFGEKILTRQVESAMGWGNQNDKTLHFGLGTETGQITVVTTWPDSYIQTNSFGVDNSVTITYDVQFSEISISGSGYPIPNGDTTPSIADGTDFGEVEIDALARETFKIANSGNINLNISDILISDSSAFQVTTFPAVSIAPGGDTIFRITFAPEEVGIFTGTVSVINNDSTANPYTFMIKGEGIPEPVILLSILFLFGGLFSRRDARPCVSTGKIMKKTITNYRLPIILFFCLTSGVLFSQNITSNTRKKMLKTTQFIDANNRVFIPQGFVANTHLGGDGKKINYLPSDYKLMQRYGANLQVVRVGLGRLGGWHGYKLSTNYLKQIDSMISNAAAVGIRSGIKLVVYDVKEFRSNGWSKLWKNKNNEQEMLCSAWETLWKRYKNNSNIFAYDLLNEPKCGDVKNTSVLEKNILAPLYRKLIDKLHSIDTNKWACFQPIHTEPTNEVFCPFAPWQTPLNRDKIIYAPHIYEYRTNNIAKRLDTYLSEANLSNAKLMLGEWGPATFKDWDTNIANQNFCKSIYEKTCTEVDKRAIGTVKAWFTGTPRWVGKNKNATWAIFKDKLLIGRTERKYIMDFLCRPRPLAIAGKLKKFGFDFATRIFTMNYIPQSNSAPTEIYVPVNRHYPDGFTLKIDNKVLFELQVSPASPSGLLPKLINSKRKIEWQSWAQRLLIYENSITSKQKKLEISPGFVETHGRASNLIKPPNAKKWK